MPSGFLRRRQDGRHPQESYRHHSAALRSHLWRIPSPQKEHPTVSKASDSLADRLQELLVFEMDCDGRSKYRRFSTRGFYRYVLNAITHVRRRGSASENLEHDHHDDADVQNVTHAYQPEPHSKMLHKTKSRCPPKPSLRRVATAGATPSTLPQYQHVTYRERLGGYLHPRDMRRLVMPFSTTNEPELIVRRHAMLLNFDPLRAIILRDRLLVLVPDGADSILSKLEDRLRGGSAGVADSIFGSDETSDNLRTFEHVTGATKSVKLYGGKRSGAGDGIADVEAGIDIMSASTAYNANDNLARLELAEYAENTEHGEDSEWLELETREWTNLPFELQCVDAVLHVVSSILTEDTLELHKSVGAYMDRVLHVRSYERNDDPLTIIRVVKDAVQLMTKRVKGFVQSMNRILDEDEDMALMNLSRLLTHPERFIHPVPQEILEEESDEPELILEANLQIGLTLLNNLDLVHGQVQTAKELVDQKLDQVRNRLLFANMMINVFMLCVSMATVVGGFFGMNVPFPNGLKENETAFRKIVFGSVGGAVGMGMVIMAVLCYSGTVTRSSNMIRSDVEL